MPLLHWFGVLFIILHIPCAVLSYCLMKEASRRFCKRSSHKYTFWEEFITFSLSFLFGSLALIVAIIVLLQDFHQDLHQDKQVFCFCMPKELKS